MKLYSESSASGWLLRLVLLYSGCFFAPLTGFAYEGLALYDTQGGVSIYRAELDLPSLSLCRNVHDQFFRALKLDCVSCTIKFQSCEEKIDQIPSEVRTKSSWIAPYILGGDSRTWFFGLDRSTTVKRCEQIAAAYRKQGLQAKCIK